MTARQGNAGIEIGNVFVSLWGYEQTNFSLYQVTRIVGKAMVEVKEIQHETLSEESENGGKYYNYSPKLDSFKDDKVIKRKVFHYGSDPTIEINSVIFAELIREGETGIVRTNPEFY